MQKGSSKGFNESLRLQRIDAHDSKLSKLGYYTQDRTADKRRLHDLHDWFRGIWFEAKTDYSNFQDRLLVEYKANLPPEYLEGVPLQKPLPYDQYLSRFVSYPAKYNSLSTDTDNLEARHYLSYLFNRTGAHYLLDLHSLRRQIRERQYDWIVFGSYESNREWRTVAQIVPVKDLSCLGRAN